nr:MAG TPA: hypothetical protein [Caudoviricetes sp.]
MYAAGQRFAACSSERSVHVVQATAKWYTRIMKT